jgi:hypothetical protein
MEDINQKWIRLRGILDSLNITQNELSIEARVNQASVSRILSQCPKRQGKAFARLCKYAFNLDTARAALDPSRSLVLMDVLREVWNGSEEHAKALAGAIRASAYAARVGGL